MRLLPLALPSEIARQTEEKRSEGEKRAKGCYYTQNNLFSLRPFKDWAETIQLSKARILEPFAGSNNLICMLQDLGLCDRYASFDIKPASKNITSKDIKKRDTIKSFPEGFEVCVTNPPWLARNSATRRGLPFPECDFDDLYKHCLSLCLEHCQSVAAILPATFLQSGLFRDRLQKYILIHDMIFLDTENPVCLALFGKESSQIEIYYDNKYLGHLSSFEAKLPKPRPKPYMASAIRFNDPRGQLGFFSFDNTKEPSIRFCHASDIAGVEIKHSSRFITRIGGHFGDIDALIHKLNQKISHFRKETEDVFLTPFKGLREDGRYRRRMDFALARRFIDTLANI